MQANATVFFSDTYYFTATVNPQNMDMDQLAMLNLDASEIFRLVVSVTVPGDIIAEGAVVEGNTATFTITDLTGGDTRGSCFCSGLSLSLFLRSPGDKCFQL